MPGILTRVRSDWNFRSALRGVVMFPGVEIAAGYVFAWAVRKARRIGGRADSEVDRALDAGMDRLHSVVSGKLGQDPALERAREEAEEGREELSERTRRRLADSLDEAAERDEEFAAALKAAVEEVQAAGRMTASDNGIVIGGNAEMHAEGGSVVAMRIDGPVTTGGANPQQPGAAKG
ncbi:hypothetical protein [Streptomyces sp. NPDC001480]|uniref:hypothetical protein n=1 Tax=Streptomyces sp. NPDC001480 TaxID=3364577 RepID=UPI0036C1360C